MPTHHEAPVTPDTRVPGYFDAALYLPVFAEGAGFYAGDGRGVQGDGEVRTTALVTGTFRFTLRKDPADDWTSAETPADLMAVGLPERLDEAMRQAVRETIRHVCAGTGLARNQASLLCSPTGSLRMTRTVDGNKGVRVLLPKSDLPKSAIPETL